VGGGHENPLLGHDLEIHHQGLGESDAGRFPARHALPQHERPEVRRCVQIAAHVVERNRVDRDVAEVEVERLERCRAGARVVFDAEDVPGRYTCTTYMFVPFSFFSLRRVSS
jgi:hypothetical protein